MTQSNAVSTEIIRQIEINAATIESAGISRKVFEEVATNALILQPGLAECSPQSVGIAVLRCAQIGLLPDGREAVIVPFRDRNSDTLTATLIPMIEGRLKLARRATPGIAIHGQLVFESDEWDYAEGLEPRLEHRPSIDGSRTDRDVIAAYAIATLPASGLREYKVMMRGDIDRYREFSRSKDRGPWKTNFQEMAIKTVIGQLLKRLPKSAQLDETPSGLEHYELESDGGSEIIEANVQRLSPPSDEPEDEDAREIEESAPPPPRQRRATAKPVTQDDMPF